MSVYQPPAFVPRNRDAAWQLVHDYPFATLITKAADEPQISHLPLLYRAESATPGALIGHMARANPHWQRFAEGPTLALFHGPHAYVSPSWYLEPEVAVPTWNYAVVHVRARAEVVTDREETLATGPLLQCTSLLRIGALPEHRAELEQGVELEATGCVVD